MHSLLNYIVYLDIIHYLLYYYINSVFICVQIFLFTTTLVRLLNSNDRERKGEGKKREGKTEEAKSKMRRENKIIFTLSLAISSPNSLFSFATMDWKYSARAWYAA